MTDNFPACIDEVTAPWLSSVLGMTVDSFTYSDIGAGKGMMGDIFRMSIFTSSGKEHSIVAKFSADREDLRVAAKRAGIFEREVNFYKLIAPRLQCRIHATYGCWYNDDSGKFLILMESIDADPSVSQIIGVTFEQAKMVMRELAVLHVPDAEVNEHRGLFNFVNAPGRRMNQAAFIANGWNSVREIVPEHLRVMDTPERMVERHGVAFDHLGSLPMFLLHGDTRPDNLLFSRDGKSVALIDWQGLTLGPREWDVGYFIAQGLRTEDRREWMDELIRYYISCVDDPTQKLTVEEMRTNIGKVAWFSLGVACSLFTVADTSLQATIELSASMAERALHLLFDAGELS